MEGTRPADAQAAGFRSRQEQASGMPARQPAEQQGGLGTYGEIITAISGLKRAILERKISQNLPVEIAQLRQAVQSYRGGDADILREALQTLEQAAQEATQSSRLPAGAAEQKGRKTYSEAIGAIRTLKDAMRDKRIDWRAAGAQLAELRKDLVGFHGGEAEALQAALSSADEKLSVMVNGAAAAQPARPGAPAPQVARAPQSAWPAPPAEPRPVAAEANRQGEVQNQQQRVEKVQVAGSRRMGGFPDNFTIRQVEQIFGLGEVLTPAQYAALQGRNDVLINVRSGGVQLHILETEHEDANHNFILLDRQQNGTWKVVGTSNSNRA